MEGDAVAELAFELRRIHPLCVHLDGVQHVGPDLNEIADQWPYRPRTSAARF